MEYDHKYIESLHFLSQTSRLLNQPLQRGELITTILEESARLSEADLAALVLQDDSRRAEVVYLLHEGRKKRFEVDPEQYSIEEDHEPMARPEKLAPDNQWNEFYKAKLGIAFEYRLRIPLFLRGKWSGFLDFYSDDIYIFEKEHLVDFLKALADSFSLAYENMELREAYQRKSLENKLLIDSSQMLANVLELDEVIAAIAEAVKLVVDYDGISIYLARENGNLDPIHWRGYEDQSRDMLEVKAGEGLVGWVARSAQGVVVDDVAADDRYIKARETTRSEMVVPIALKNRVLGAFNIESDRPGAFTAHDLELLSTFAAKSAIAIERATLYRELVMKKQLDQEVSIARSIQQTFLPREELKIEGFDLAGKNISSRQVGGDYYDYIKIEDSQIGLVIADVVGKGVPASLIMASFRASLIAEIRNNYAIRAIMQKVNRLMTESLDSGNFVTAVYGVLDSRSRIFTYSNAGHNPPILIRSDGRYEELTEGGLALGIDMEARYNERPIGLNSGDTLVFFTDGVIEAQDENEELFDTPRLIDIIRENRQKSARNIVDIIVKNVLDYKSEDFSLDDLTIMIIKVK